MALPILDGPACWTMGQQRTITPCWIDWAQSAVDGNASRERLTSRIRTTSHSNFTLYWGMTQYNRMAADNRAGTGAFAAVKSATSAGDPTTALSAPKVVGVINLVRDPASWGRARGRRLHDEIAVLGSQ